MQHLLIQELYYKYKNSTLPIFDNLSIEFEEGWSCIVGANGSGKSTLLQLISKEIILEEGSIKGNDLTHYCTQSTQYPPDTLEDFMLTFNSKSFKIRNLLNIKDEWLYRWDDLSCGEKKRIQLAVALFEEPDILLVDEPTNHLDAKSKDIVLKALKSFKGIGILVSHDRELLDSLSTSTYILKNRNIMVFKTTYTNAISEYNTNTEYLEKNQEKQNQELKKLKKSIQNQHEKVSQSKKRMSKKDLGKNDKNSKTKIDLARFTGKDKNDGQELAKLKSKQSKLISNAVTTDKTYALGIEFNTTKYTNIFPIVIENKTLELSETKRLSYRDLSVNRYDKIGIIGENGSGKTSFLNDMLSKADFKNECLYIPQEISEEESKNLFDEINNLPNEEKGEVYTIIRQLSSDPIKLQDSFMPSPGEIRKLMIAKGLLNSPSLIILDEPTNHMDLNSIVCLEIALKQYNGTMIIISHDKTFLKNVVNDIWEFKQENEDLYTIIH
ncbi:MAG: ATP-binding cassette domain-containing protein [Arcobacteraceae bacterium]